MNPENFTLQDREDDLRAALAEAVLLADGDAIEAAALLCPAVAAFLDVPDGTIRYGEHMALGREPKHCPSCGSDDLGVFAASEDREDEADLVACERCRWQAAITPEGVASLRAGE